MKYMMFPFPPKALGDAQCMQPESPQVFYVIKLHPILVNILRRFYCFSTQKQVEKKKKKIPRVALIEAVAL